jgi:hypothetical protein
VKVRLIVYSIFVKIKMDHGKVHQHPPKNGLVRMEPASRSYWLNMMVMTHRILSAK